MLKSIRKIGGKGTEWPKIIIDHNAFQFMLRLIKIIEWLFSYTTYSTCKTYKAFKVKQYSFFILFRICYRIVFFSCNHCVGRRLTNKAKLIKRINIFLINKMCLVIGFYPLVTKMVLSWPFFIPECCQSTHWSEPKGRHKTSKTTNCSSSTNTTCLDPRSRSPSAPSVESRTATSCASSPSTAPWTCSSRRAFRSVVSCPDFCCPARSNMREGRTVLSPCHRLTSSKATGSCADSNLEMQSYLNFS